jgi:hypothetical protein
MSEYTKGPLVAMKKPAPSNVDHGWRAIGMCGAEWMLAVTYEQVCQVEDNIVVGKTWDNAANAERFETCWNACVDVDSTELEKVSYADLKQQLLLSQKREMDLREALLDLRMYAYDPNARDKSFQIADYALSTPPTLDALNKWRDAEIEKAFGEPQWIVNDIGELGVKINERFFFLYKGESLEYEDGTHDDGTPILYRIVGKREFGETQWPQKWVLDGRRPEGRYTEKLEYIQGLSFGKPEDGDWQPINPLYSKKG